ncbi:MAG: hypothetical protein HQL00_03895 [Nitrospirae bacterium]|nr:hypothetical protein [Nitrospirota bacterium]
MIRQRPDLGVLITLLIKTANHYTTGTGPKRPASCYLSANYNVIVIGLTTKPPNTNAFANTALCAATAADIIYV